MRVSVPSRETARDRVYRVASGTLRQPRFDCVRPRTLRILVLDNHDDFGGHAKRNEFKIGDETRIGYGGTESIDTPSSYSQVTKDLLVELGIDTSKFYEAFDQKLYSSMGLSKGIVFDKETFGTQKLVVGYSKIPWEEFAAQTPMNAQAKKDLVRVQTEKRDYLPELTNEEKHKKLRRVSYEAFLRANSDAGGSATTKSAIDQAWRAVRETLSS
ncbi:MAG: hypothetical protein E2P02_07545 [Acidobacteria bacterium]|nr:MAG: hypothetical protein E2P02_07545 [Acidobacteriota bacterium]